MMMRRGGGVDECDYYYTGGALDLIKIKNVKRQQRFRFYNKK